MVVGHRQPFEGGVGRALGGGEGLGGEAAGGEGLVAFAAEVVDRGEPPLRLGVPEPVAAAVVPAASSRQALAASPSSPTSSAQRP